MLKDAIDNVGDDILGSKVIDKYGGWTMYAKFFDNMEPLPLHLHQDNEKAANVGRKGKPEGYYFPKQLNNHSAYFPHTYFGLYPGTNRDAIKNCLEMWYEGDNGIQEQDGTYLRESCMHLVHY